MWTREQWVAAVTDSSTKIAAEAWEDHALPADVAAAQPVPDYVVTYFASGYGRRESFLTNKHVPVAERARVLRASGKRERLIITRLLDRPEVTAAEWAAFWPFLADEKARITFYNASRTAPDRTVAALDLLRAGDVGGRERLAATMVLTDQEAADPFRLPIQQVITDPSPLVRAALPRNGSIFGLRNEMSVATYRVLYALVTDPDPAVRMAARLARVTFYSSETFRDNVLSRRPDLVAEAEGRRVGIDGLFPDWLDDADPKVRVAILKRYTGERIFTRLLTDVAAVKVKLARVPNLPVWVIERLGEDESAPVRRAALAAEGAPVEMVLRLADDPVESVRRAAGDRVVAALATGTA